MSAFTPAGSGGLPPPTVSFSGDSTPVIANVAITLAATEYSYALPASTTSFLLKLRSALADLYLSYTVAQSGVTYITVPRGTSLSVAGLDPAAAITLYFQSPSSTQLLEIMSWS